jgi:hypothetical protein
MGIGNYNLVHLPIVCSHLIGGTGKLDDLVCYRLVQAFALYFEQRHHTGRFFSRLFEPVENGKAQGIGGYLLDSPYDRAFAFDYDGSGKPDDLAMYRPGRELLCARESAHHTCIIQFEVSAPPPEGIGGYPLTPPRSRYLLSTTRQRQP